MMQARRSLTVEMYMPLSCSCSRKASMSDRSIFQRAFPIGHKS